MNVISQGIKRWLGQLELRASTTHWTDQQAAHYRNTRRAVVEICEVIRARLLQIGLSPVLAVSLQRGEEAAAELAAIPDSEALRMADQAITRDDVGERAEARSRIEAKLDRMVERFRGEPVPDLAQASLVELLAFCEAFDANPST